MRIKPNHFIVILFFLGCKENANQAIEKEMPLYTEPITVALNTTTGYSINQLTGDSIKPIINSLGDTIQTGIPVSLKASVANVGKINKPTFRGAGVQKKESILSNIHPVTGNPETIQGDTINIQNSSEITNKGVPINVTGKTIPLNEPKPVKTLPLRFKDGATSNIQYLEVGQGLSYSFVHSILVDKNGYLWFGLDGNGLCKYDGNSITNYTQRDGLLNNNITSLLEDDKGNIWIGSDGGLSVFDGKNLTQYTKENGMPANAISSMYKDKKGNIWMNSFEIGHICYDGKKFYQYANTAKLPMEIIFPLFTDSQNNVWFRTKSGLAKFDGRRFINFPISKKSNDSSGYKIIEDRKGFIWVGTTWNGIYRYDGSKIIHYTDKEGLSGNSILSLTDDKYGTIWIGTRYNGINKFDGINFTKYSITEGMTSNVISQVLEDKAGNIWCSTEGGGVNKLNDNGFKEIINKEQLGNSRVRPVMKDEHGNLWFGTETGNIYKYDGKDITRYIINSVLQSEGLRSMLADKKQNLWFGFTDNGGLYKYDKKKFLHFTNSSGINASNIMSILEDRNGVIWLGTFGGGINRIDANTFTYYNEKEKFASKSVFAILEDKKGNLWFGTQGGGVVKYDGTAFLTFSEREGMYGRGITSIVEDEEGNLWFGTLGAGLCKFDGKSFTYFTDKQGLSFNDVWSLTEDSIGQFWAGTDKGLSLLIPQKNSINQLQKKYSIYSFGFQDGLKGTDFNLHSVCIDNNNRIWWGTGKALITRDLNNVFVASTPSSLNLNHIEINGQFYDFRNIIDSNNHNFSFSHVRPFTNYPQGLKLNYNQNHLTFHFSAIDWSAQDKIKYSFRLLGLDEGWSKPSDATITEYRNLSYGSYTLQVKAIGQSHIWTKIISYPFTIRPAFWQTWWFKTSIIIFASLLLLFISRLIYLTRLRKQKMILEKQLAVQYERQRISSEMHDDIGAGLSGVKLLTEITKTKLKDKDAKNEIDKIYQSVSEISAKMKEVIWGLNTENDDLTSLIYFIQKQTRALLENYPAQLLIDIPEGFPDIKIRGEARRNIYLSVKEALHNIIKHAGADKITLSITCNDKLVINISDNGKGINISVLDQSGNGLKNMQRRIENLHGVFHAQNHNGTIITFEIPLKSIT